jgi:hypothetical protein
MQAAGFASGIKRFRTHLTYLELIRMKPAQDDATIQNARSRMAAQETLDFVRAARFESPMSH